VIRLVAIDRTGTLASTRILTKLGFTQVGWAEDDDVGTVWDWHLIDVTT
jgi:hypothetical protein